MSKRCVCCQRYAPKAIEGVAGNGKVIQGEPPGQCHGNVAIEEARDLARLWYKRAHDMGYGTTKCACGTAIAANLSECTACFEAESDRFKTEIVDKVNRTTSGDADYPRQVSESISDTVGVNPGPTAMIHSDWMRLYGRLPSKSNDKAGQQCACAELDLQCFRHCETCYSMLAITDPDGGATLANRHCANHNCPKCVHEGEDRTPTLATDERGNLKDEGEVSLAANASVCDFRGDWCEYHNRSSAKCEKNAELTKDEILHAKWIYEGKKLAYCQGKRRHFCIVDSTMHEQMLATGCFHCGAFPEVPK
jgi:hypothetical protein